MKLKFMNKMIAIMCAATVATSGVVTSVGAVGETEAIEQMAIEQMKYNIQKLEQKQKELEKETSCEETCLKNGSRTEGHQEYIDKVKESIDCWNRNKKTNYRDKDPGELDKRLEESKKYSKDNRNRVIRLQSAIEMIKQDRARVNRNLIELINKNKKALKDIDRQIKDARKQVEFMEAFQALGNKISEFTRWNASKKAVVSYTDVIAKNIMARCLELKNNFQARRANAIIQQIKKSIEAMQQYIKKYELKHTNENNPTKLFKAKKNEAIKNSKMLGHKSKENDDSNTSNKLIGWKANGTFGGFSGNFAVDIIAEDKKENDFLSISDSFSSSLMSISNNKIEHNSVDGGDNIEDCPISLNSSLSNRDCISISDSFMMKRRKNISGNRFSFRSNGTLGGVSENKPVKVEENKPVKVEENKPAKVPVNNSEKSLLVIDGEMFHSIKSSVIDNSANGPVNDSEGSVYSSASSNIGNSGNSLGNVD